MKVLLKGFSYILILTLLFACDRGVDNPDDIQKIYYGTSFGECLGYCNKSIEVSDKKVKFIKSGWDTDGLLPVKKSTESFTKEEWDILVEAINKDRFLELNAVYGCPDCIDGGAEWIQIEIIDSAYTVSFEYLREPPSLTDIADKLRELMAEFE